MVAGARGRLDSAAMDSRNPAEEPNRSPWSGDTSLDAERARYAALRKLSGAQRIALMEELTELARSLMRNGLRQRHPDLSEAEIEVKFFELTLGRKLASQVLESRGAPSSLDSP